MVKAAVRPCGYHLHAADPQAVLVGGLVGWRLAPEDRVDLRDEGEHHHVEFQVAAVGQDPEQVHLMLHRGPLLGRRDALLQIELLAGLQDLEGLLVAGPRHLREDR